MSEQPEAEKPKTARDAASVDSKSVSDPLIETQDYRQQPDAFEAKDLLLELPKLFGRYEVHSLLGKGGFGAVYRGFDPQLKRDVAIKVPFSGRPLEGVAQEFLQEAQRLAQLKHVGVVAVHDVGVQKGHCYIVSDFLEGPSLDQWLKEQRPTWQEAARITAAIADALAHAHAERTVHRDLKPSNVIITRGATPVLVDFGLAISESSSTNRERGVISGTPHYMSPEQARGAGHRIDGRTDIYALGVILYHMLTRRLPFRATTVAELLRQVLEDAPQPPRQLAPDIPPALEHVCLKALAKHEAARYTTAGDMAAELRQILAQPAQPPAAAPPADVRTPSAALAALPADETPSAIRRAGEAERRQVTMLFCGCDLFESEQFLEKLDDEDQSRLARSFHEACAQVVQQLGGTVVQANEEGMLVCFGYPIAQEDAPRRAARAGLGVLDSMASFHDMVQSRYGLGIAAWVGIHTGSAVVETQDDGASISVVGEARNLVTRLEGEPNTVVCTDSTQQLVRGYFECERLGDRKIKGVARQVGVFRITHESAARGAIDVALPAGLTPLTGRDREVGLLQDRWEQAQEGMGQVVLLVGEAGLGPEDVPFFVTFNLKGALPAEAIARLQGERVRLEHQPPRAGESPRDRKIRESKILFGMADKVLDGATSGPFHLKDPNAAKIVENSILFGAVGQAFQPDQVSLERLTYLHHENKSARRYDLFAWCVMANHVHVLLKPFWELEKVMQGMKGFTAHEINGLQNARGRVFWQDESYDHWVRDEEEMARIIQYIENNPVAAGLCAGPQAWPWSSARFRDRWAVGQPFQADCCSPRSGWKA